LISAGVIDEDYTGKVGVVLFNHGDQPFEVKPGDRVAQLICEQIFYPELQEVQVGDPFSSLLLMSTFCPKVC